jgi:hypothetical protein
MRSRRTFSTALKRASFPTWKSSIPERAGKLFTMESLPFAHTISNRKMKKALNEPAGSLSDTSLSCPPSSRLSPASYCTSVWAPNLGIAVTSLLAPINWSRSAQTAQSMSSPLSISPTIPILEMPPRSDAIFLSLRCQAEVARIDAGAIYAIMARDGTEFCPCRFKHELPRPP